MHLPTLRQLQFLTALADAGSFSRAAEACLVTQPTLSAAIKEIEALIGTPLVERTGRSSRLTGAGEIAVERARQILAETEEMVTLARGAGAPFGGYGQSGNGREGGEWGIEEFCEVKSVSGWAPADA